ncbi:hypothetical protein [Pedobacter miscanthi]|uniref:Lipoprotein n=1 Tax=Pedobacter miscanthi TaxID=2259170 RepID=A0A366KUQ7_9SPHI|nr:hypothetical protein [Pedobacter miscanthi]RBQ05250.1 hypothetical protein DRW42_16345 [Pedobacter miscanthi]
MKAVNTLLLIFMLCSILACRDQTSGKSETQKGAIKIDTTKAVKIDGYWAVPKPSFDFNTWIKNTKDTLRLVTCSKYVYSPFGELKSKNAITKSLLNKFLIKDSVIKYENYASAYHFLTHKTSKLILYFDKDGPTHSYIFKGLINNADVDLENGIKIGMDKADFLNHFFNSFPKEIMDKYNFIKFDSCIQDIIHSYTFKQGKLVSVDFITDSYLDINF